MAAQSDAGQQEPFQRVSVEKAKEILDQGNAAVIDVRNPDEWVAGHVKGAIHIPVDEVLNRVDELPKEKNLLFICAAGVRSALACEMAASMGVPPKYLFNVEEGTPTWIERNLPTSYGDDP